MKRSDRKQRWTVHINPSVEHEAYLAKAMAEARRSSKLSESQLVKNALMYFFRRKHGLDFTSKLEAIREQMVEHETVLRKLNQEYIKYETMQAQQTEAEAAMRLQLLTR